jgi:hypothetical protein
MFVIAMARLLQVVPAQLMQQSSLNEPIKCFTIVERDCRAQFWICLRTTHGNCSRFFFSTTHYTLHGATLTSCAASSSQLEHDLTFLLANL